MHALVRYFRWAVSWRMDQRAEDDLTKKTVLGNELAASVPCIKGGWWRS